MAAMQHAPEKPGLFFGGGGRVERGLGVVGLFIYFFMFPMCSHKVLMVFPRFPMGFDKKNISHEVPQVLNVFPQNVPNTTTL
jgi:hypothetical protein